MGICIESVSPIQSVESVCPIKSNFESVCPIKSGAIQSDTWVKSDDDGQGSVFYFTLPPCSGENR